VFVREKKLLIDGKRSTHLTQFDIAKRRTLGLDHFKGMYKLMSIQTHTAPLSINFNVVGARFNNRNEFSITLIELTLNYSSHFVAEVIQSISNLWNFKFAKKESEAIVTDYSNELKN